MAVSGWWLRGWTARRHEISLGETARRHPQTTLKGPTALAAPHFRVLLFLDPSFIDVIILVCLWLKEMVFSFSL